MNVLHNAFDKLQRVLASLEKDDAGIVNRAIPFAYPKDAYNR